MAFKVCSHPNHSVILWSMCPPQIQGLIPAHSEWIHLLHVHKNILGQTHGYNDINYTTSAHCQIFIVFFNYPATASIRDKTFAWKAHAVMSALSLLKDAMFIWVRMNPSTPLEQVSWLCGYSYTTPTAIHLCTTIKGENRSTLFSVYRLNPTIKSR